MSVFFDIIYALFCTAYLPLMVVRGKWHKGFWYRLGFFPPEESERFRGQKIIWVHAVSVGEVQAVQGLVNGLRERYTDYTVVLSVVTKTGVQLARRLWGDDLPVIFAPLDFSWVVRKYVTMLRPRVYIAAETELWPNVYSCLNKFQTPIIQVNGRISDKAFKGYQKILWLTRRVLAFGHFFCMQTPVDADRIVQMGADLDKVKILGNLKFDQTDTAAETDEALPWFDPEDEYWVAGSTHPGEEVLLLTVYKALITEFPRLRLILAPRHPERAGEVCRIVDEAGLISVKYSDTPTRPPDSQTVMVVDEIGRLRMLYRKAAVVFIGKTLVIGEGQNMIEPAYYAKPVVIGPRAVNFKDVVQLLEKNAAIMRVADVAGLQDQMHELMGNPHRRKEIGEAARATVQQYQGTTALTIEEIDRVMVSEENGHAVIL